MKTPPTTTSARQLGPIVLAMLLVTAGCTGTSNSQTADTSTASTTTTELPEGKWAEVQNTEVKAGYALRIRWKSCAPQYSVAFGTGGRESFSVVVWASTGSGTSPEITEQAFFVPAETVPGTYPLYIDCDPAGDNIEGLPEITVLPADERSEPYSPDTTVGLSPNVFCITAETVPDNCLVNDQIPFL